MRLSDMRLVDVAYEIMHAEIIKVKQDIRSLGYKMVENLYIYMYSSLLDGYSKSKWIKLLRLTVRRNDLWTITELCA